MKVCTMTRSGLTHLTRKKSVSATDDVTRDAVRAVTIETVFVTVYKVYVEKKWHILEWANDCAGFGGR